MALGIADALGFEAFRVVTARTRKQGCAIARHEKPNAVLLDLMLPDINGYQVCEEIRRHDAFVPIMMPTAPGQEADQIRGVDAGGGDYLTKPFSPGELVARLRALLRRASRPTETL